MDEQTKPICNSTHGGDLGVQLEQPTRYIESPRDVESGAYPIVDDDDDDYDKGEEADNEEEENDAEEDAAGADAPDTQILQPEESKVPPQYQSVEPGCTPLSCYSSIITFIIMVIGIVWLLVYSIPEDAKHRSIYTLNETNAKTTTTAAPTSSGANVIPSILNVNFWLLIGLLSFGSISLVEKCSRHFF